MDWNFGKCLLIASLTLSTAVSHAKLSEDNDVFSVASAVNGPSNDYREVSDLALKILQKYPPTQYQYVGVGRGPTPIIAALQAILGEAGAVNIPVTNLKYVGRMDDIDSEFDVNEFYKRNSRILNHVSQLLPSEKELGDRKVLVIDLVRDPKNVLQYQSLFNDVSFERNKNAPRAVQVLAVGRKANAYVDFQRAGIETMNVGSSFHGHLISRLYYELAEYAPVDFSTPDGAAINLRKRQEFADLRQAYIERIRADLPFLIDLIALELKGLPVVKGISRKLLAKVPGRSTDRGRAIDKCISLLQGLID